LEMRHLRARGARRMPCGNPFEAPPDKRPTTGFVKPRFHPNENAKLRVVAMLRRRTTDACRRALQVLPDRWVTIGTPQRKIVASRQHPNRYFGGQIARLRRSARRRREV
jgi:hypothetical protein